MEEDAAASEDTANSVAALKRALENEKNAPDILRYQHDVVAQLKSDLESQQDAVDALLGGGREAFASTLYQMEIDRVKYLLASYLRTRLFKIERLAAYLTDPDNAALRELMSKEEWHYAEKYMECVHGHFKACVLGQLPEMFQGLFEKGGDVDMVPKPNMDKFVFSRAEGDVGSVPMDEAGTAALIRKGDIYALRYHPVSGTVSDGDMSLL